MAVNPLLVGGGVVTAAAVVGGGLYAGGVFSSSQTPQQTGNGRGIQEPKIVSLKDANEQGTYNNKFGGKYAYYFLSTKTSENSETWSKIADSIKSDTQLTSESFFNEIKTKTGDDKLTALKAKCAEKYGEDEDTSKANKWNEVWTYCSLVGGKPTTIQNASTAIASVTGSDKEKAYTTGTDSKFGQTLKAELISTFDPKNEKFWTQREKEFKAGDLAGTGATSTYFNKDKADRKEIKIMCRDAYEKTAPSSGDTADAPSDTNIKKYCAL